ncbi:MAG: hypothetical protein R2764_14650 [Bacteroidales bacterium]
MMRRLTFYVIILIAFMASGSFQSAMGQNKLTLDPGGDIVSRYVWRGADFGNSPAIQPSMELGYAGLALGAWGSFSTNNANFQEVDLYLSYTFANDMFSVMVTDYFFPNDTIANNKYFDYNTNSTGHVFEGTLKFNGTDKIPVSLMIATNFAGADARKADNKLQYSTYIELGYSTSIGNTSFDFFLGGTPTNPDGDKGETGYYGPYSGIVNIGLTAGREIQITEKFALPVNVSLITNPQQENIFFVFGISL